MFNQRRSQKIRQTISARPLGDTPGSPAKTAGASPGKSALTKPGTDQRVKIGDSPREPHTGRVSLAVATIGGMASITAAALTGPLLNSGGTHPTPSPSALASARATARAGTPTPVASAVHLPANPLMPGDDSTFIADITYRDGTKVPEGRSFIKTWEIKNIGSVPWVGRYLAPDGKITGACTYPPRVPVPTTYPGKPAIISVPVVAPSTPQVCFVTWKMVNAAGDLYFPNEEGMWFNVTIVTPRGVLPQIPGHPLALPERATAALKARKSRVASQVCNGGNGNCAMQNPHELQIWQSVSNLCVTRLARENGQNSPLAENGAVQENVGGIMATIKPQCPDRVKPLVPLLRPERADMSVTRPGCEPLASTCIVGDLACLWGSDWR